jgi:hypothetical protein
MKKYIKPEAEIEEFILCDIISLSGDVIPDEGGGDAGLPV